MNSTSRLCVICHQESAPTAYALGGGDTYRIHVNCENCGVYEVNTISGAFDVLRNLSDRDSDWKLLPYLAAHIRQATDAGVVVLITGDTWRDLAEGHRATPVPVRLQKLLEQLARETAIGRWLYLKGQERRLAATADIKDVDELDFVLRHLNDTELIEYQPMPPPLERRRPDGGYDSPEQAVRLTVSGWSAVAPASGGVPNTVFVAMSFRDELKDAYDRGITPAVETDCKLKVVRIDRVRHNDNITNRIIAGIRSAQILIADFTFQNPGVYYESGYAEALGRMVVRTCRADDFHRLHFDTRQFFHIKWTTPEDLRTLLAEHIQATRDVRR